MRKWTFIVAGLLLVCSSQTDFPNIEGWKGAGKVAVYQPENLWELINGAAELFLSYGFEKLDVRDMSREDMTVTVGIYDMENPLQAFGIFNAEKPRNSESLAIGSECIVSPPYQVLIFKDRYYIKIDALEGEITQSAGEALARAIVKALPGTECYPEELKGLPVKGRIAGSEGYVRENYLGMIQLKRCLFADYESMKGPVRVFLMLPAEGETTEMLWKRLASDWRVMPEEHILYREIPYQGLTGLIRTASGIIGTSGAENTAELVLRFESFQASAK